MASLVTARFPRAFRLLPLLIPYVLFVLLKAKDGFIGDEHRYLLGAQNILKGFLASEETLFLWNGPGYPLYLVPFAGLLHGTSKELLKTECLSAFFICSAAYHYLSAIRGGPGGPSRPALQALWAGLHLAGLALTKVFFGYALAVGLLAAGLWWMVSGLRAPRNAVLACAYALAFCLPYLAYTYKLTGKLFFWSNSGGSQLYCMSLREKEFLGDWLNFDAVLTFRDFFKTQVPFYEELSRMVFGYPAAAPAGPVDGRGVARPRYRYGHPPRAGWGTWEGARSLAGPRPGWPSGPGTF